MNDMWADVKGERFLMCNAEDFFKIRDMIVSILNINNVDDVITERKSDEW